MYDDEAPHVSAETWQLIQDRNLPVLGICYGMQLSCEALGGKVDNTPSKEYGPAVCQIKRSDSLFE